MHAKMIDHLFRFTYQKSAAEIIEKMRTKIDKVKDKIEERQRRLADLRREHAIDDAALIQLLTAARKNVNAQSYSYTSNVSATSRGMEERTIGAGVVNNLLTENDFIESERDAVKRMEMIVRNLKPIPHYASSGTPLPEQEFELGQEELEYLGF